MRHRRTELHAYEVTQIVEASGVSGDAAAAAWRALRSSGAQDWPWALQGSLSLAGQNAFESARLADALAAAASPAFVAASVAAAVVAKILRPFRQWLRIAYHMQALPGPKSSGLLGDMTPDRIFKATRFQTAWAREFGGVYVQRAAHIYTVIVSDPALMVNLINLPKAFIYPMIDEVTQGRPNLLTRKSEDPHYKVLRKAVAPVFSQSNLKRVFPEAVTHVDLLLARLLLAAQRGEPVELIQETQMALVHMMGHLAFEMDLADPTRQRSLAAALDAKNEALRALTRNMITPLRQQLFFWQDSVRRDAAALRTWNEIMAALTTDALGTMDMGNESSIVAALHGARLSGGRALTLEELQTEVTMFFIAGIDTVSHTLAWTLLLLSQHPECAAKIVRELEDRGLKAAPGRPARDITFADLSDLDYLNACIKEAMRVESVASAGTWREADRDLVVGDYLVPEGTSIALLFGAAFTSADNFPEASTFKPERWQGAPAAEDALADAPGGASEAALGAAGAVRQRACPFTGAKSEGQLPQQMFPFSVGNRTCIGKPLAQLQLTLVLARLFAVYHVGLATDRNTVEQIYQEEVVALTLGPRSLYVRLTPWEDLSAA